MMDDDDDDDDDDDYDSIIKNMMMTMMMTMYEIVVDASLISVWRTCSAYVCTAWSFSLFVSQPYQVQTWAHGRSRFHPCRRWWFASKNKSKKQVMNKDSKKLVGKLATKMTSKKPAANAKRKKTVIKAAKTKKPMIKAETKKKETRQTTKKESKQKELAEELSKEIEQVAATEAEKEDGMSGNLKTTWPYQTWVWLRRNWLWLCQPQGIPWRRTEDSEQVRGRDERDETAVAAGHWIAFGKFHPRCDLRRRDEPRPCPWCRCDDIRGALPSLQLCREGQGNGRCPGMAVAKLSQVRSHEEATGLGFGERQGLGKREKQMDIETYPANLEVGRIQVLLCSDGYQGAWHSTKPSRESTWLRRWRSTCGLTALSAFLSRFLNHDWRGFWWMLGRLKKRQSCPRVCFPMSHVRYLPLNNYIYIYICVVGGEHVFYVCLFLFFCFLLCLSVKFNCIWHQGGVSWTRRVWTWTTLRMKLSLMQQQAEVLPSDAGCVSLYHKSARRPVGPLPSAGWPACQHLWSRRTTRVEKRVGGCHAGREWFREWAREGV